MVGQTPPHHIVANVDAVEAECVARRNAREEDVVNRRSAKTLGSAWVGSGRSNRVCVDIEGWLLLLLVERWVGAVGGCGRRLRQLVGRDIGVRVGHGARKDRCAVVGIQSVHAGIRKLVRVDIEVACKDVNLTVGVTDAQGCAQVAKNQVPDGSLGPYAAPRRGQVHRVHNERALWADKLHREEAARVVLDR